jgi:group I intron endonuclease
VTGIIYLAVNRVNQKAYVGQTTMPIHTRLQNHATCKSKRPFTSALLKYGAASFDFTILGRYPVNELRSREIEWVDRLGSYTPVGYNLAVAGGGGVPGRKSPETSARMKLRVGPNNPNFGRHWKHTEESKQNFKQAQNRPDILEANRKRATKYNPLCRPDKREAAISHLKAVATSQWADPESRSRKIEGIKRAWADPIKRAARLVVPNAGRFKKQQCEQ